MPNLELFRTIAGKFIPATDTRNAAGGVAYTRSPKSELAQLAMTGCLNGTYHAQAEVQLEAILKRTAEIDPAWIARLALVARKKGHMKDVPALLLATLAVRDRAVAERVFPLVVDNARMLRTFVQIVRSGAAGRKSFGSAPRRWIRQWLDSRSLDQLLDASVGNQPSLSDIVKMVHPRPVDPEREAFYGWLLGKEVAADALPGRVRALLAWREGARETVPDTAFELLTDRPLSTGSWAAIARRAGWQWTRMNLATLSRHGVFADPAMVDLVAARLRDPSLIARSRVFPYQILSAWKAAGTDLPSAIRDALQDALEHAVGNVPAFAGKVVVLPDVSGSMHSPVTGFRPGASSATRCVDVAALFAAAILRRNPSATVIPFKEDIVNLVLNPRDSISTNAERMASVGPGGTDCSAPLRHLNQRKAKADLVVFVSDNESWMDPARGRGTTTLREWETFRSRNPGARLVCIDLAPNTTVQAPDRPDILNVGGFSDQVFGLVGEFASGGLEAGAWEARIEREGDLLLNAA